MASVISPAGQRAQAWWAPAVGVSAWARARREAVPCGHRLAGGLVLSSGPHWALPAASAARLAWERAALRTGCLRRLAGPGWGGGVKLGAWGVSVAAGLWPLGGKASVCQCCEWGGAVCEGRLHWQGMMHHHHWRRAAAVTKSGGGGRCEELLWVCCAYTGEGSATRASIVNKQLPQTCMAVRVQRVGHASAVRAPAWQLRAQYSAVSSAKKRRERHTRGTSFEPASKCLHQCSSIAKSDRLAITD